WAGRRSVAACARRAPAPPGAALLGTARSWGGIFPSTHLAREGRMKVTIGRRELLAALGGAAAAWPLAGRPRPSASPVVGFLNVESLEGYRPMAAAFRPWAPRHCRSDGRILPSQMEQSFNGILRGSSRIPVCRLLFYALGLRFGCVLFISRRLIPILTPG